MKQLGSSHQDRENFHHIQRMSLFEQSESEYEPEFHDQYFSRPAQRFRLLLEFSHVPIGITTLDIIEDDRAITRSVAVSKEFQREGHGKALGKLVQEFARSLGVKRLHVNADKKKTGYYESLGFKEDEWGKEDLIGIDTSNIVQMTYILD